MEWKDLLGELIALIKATAPEVWHIAVQQVWANVAGMGLWAVCLIAAVVASIRLVRHSRCMCEKDSVWHWELGHRGRVVPGHYMRRCSPGAAVCDPPASDQR